MFSTLKKFTKATCRGFSHITLCPSVKVERRKRQPVVFYGDKKSDMDRLADDWATIGNDMRIAIASYGGRNGR